MTDAAWMKLAYELAKEAAEAGEVPVGAVLVDKDNQLIATARNRLRETNSPLAHAELLVIQQASQRLANYRLLDTTLYVSLEPCPMCAGALVQARIKRLVFACRDFKTGAAGSVYNLLKGYPLNHQVQIDEGLLEADCAQLLTDFFKAKR